MNAVQGMAQATARRHALRMVAVAAMAGAACTSASAGLLDLFGLGSAPAPSEVLPFEVQALQTIKDVVPDDALISYLAPPQAAMQGLPSKGPFLMYADTAAQPLLVVECARNVAFPIVAQGSVKGTIGVGLCDEQTELLKNRTAPAADLLAAVLKDLRVPPDDAKRMGLVHDKARVSKNADLYYYAVISTGRGLAVMPTVVVFNQGRSLVVQADITNLCDGKQQGPALCRDTKDGLMQVAQKLAKAYGLR